MSTPRILLTGSTGFIGGAILHQLFESGITSMCPISVFVRGEDKAQVLKSTYGVKTYLFNSLDETDLLREFASKHDIVIHTATDFHTASAKALILGLGDRKAQTGNKVHYFHYTNLTLLPTSGTSDIANQPLTKPFLDPNTSPTNPRIFSDKHDNIYTYLLHRESLHSYAQRTTDLTVIHTGLEVLVPTTILMSPLIYGISSSIFHQTSIQIPAILLASLLPSPQFIQQAKQVSVLSAGSSVWDYVHVSDLASLYTLLISLFLSHKQEKIPTEEKGMMLTGTGRFQFKDISEGVAEALFDAGKIDKRELRIVGVSEAARLWTAGDEGFVELGWGSDAKTVADYAFEMGWVPKYSEEDFKGQYTELVEFMTRE